MLIMYIALLAVVFGLTFLLKKEAGNMLIDLYFYSVSSIVKDINKKSILIENDVRNLASFAEVYYEQKPGRAVLKKYTKKLFEDNPDALGGGVWSLPYKFDKNKKYYCIYLYNNAKNEIVEDIEFESEGYDYLHQKWYEEIIEGIAKGNETVWSTPYYESIGSKTFMVTVGKGVYYNGELVGVITIDWKLEDIAKAITGIKPTPNSFSLFADKNNDFIIASNDYYINNAEIIGKQLNRIPWYNAHLKEVRYFKYNGVYYVPYVKYLDNGMVIIVNVPQKEIFEVMTKHSINLLLALLAFSILLTFFIYVVLERNIIKPIDKLSDMANKIGDGETDIRFKLEKPLEFSHLAMTFDKMTHDLKRISKKQAKLDLELSVAKSIQASSLPNVFPPFPECCEFDIFASMTPARDVGGDFYDFYFTGPNTIMFLIADVSGKGIPAALFMMKAKTIISNNAQTTCPPEELIRNINNSICEDNKENLFITMFAGILDITSGELTCINCGHNPPLLLTGNNYKYLKLKPNSVLGLFKNAEFKIDKIQLKKGDRIFVYTDGITEAVNSSEEIYGGERLLESINTNKNENIYDTLKDIKENVAEFVKDNEQSDDMTMLIMQYNGTEEENPNKKIFRESAKQENYKKLYTWLHKNCDEWNVNDSLKARLDMCMEEIFANVIFYAYPEGVGAVEVVMENINGEISLQFIDEGVPYNPLAKADPDINLPPEERPLGGLGIFMVKQMASKIDYVRQDGKNIFTIVLA